MTTSKTIIMNILTVTLVVLCVLCIVCLLYHRLPSLKQILMPKELRPSIRIDPGIPSFNFREHQQTHL